MSQLYIKMEGEFQTTEAIAELMTKITEQILKDAIRGEVETQDGAAFCDWSVEADR